MKPDFRLDGKVTLMTGATGGIGHDSCLALAAMGSDMGILYFNDQEHAKKLAQEIGKLGRQAYLMELDALYCDVIVQRWEQFTGRAAQLATSTDH